MLRYYLIPRQVLLIHGMESLIQLYHIELLFIIFINQCYSYILLIFFSIIIENYELAFDLIINLILIASKVQLCISVQSAYNQRIGRLTGTNTNESNNS